VRTYLLRRVLAVIPVMLVVATVTFVLVHLAPGDPASIIAGPDATPENIARLRHHLGLDEPLPSQLVHWYGRLLRGDLGDSIFLRRPVTEAIVERLEPTLLLTSWATLIAVLIGVPAGIVSARYHNTAVDQSFMGLALVGLSIPNFLLGLLMILVFGVWLRWLPVVGSLALAALVLAFSYYGHEFRQFVELARVELRKIVWPNRQETGMTTLVVFIFVVVAGIFFWLLDLGLAWATKLITGQGS